MQEVATNDQSRQHKKRGLWVTTPDLARIPGAVLRRLRDLGAKGTTALRWTLMLALEQATAQRDTVRASAERTERAAYDLPGLSRASMERHRKLFLEVAADSPKRGIYTLKAGGGVYGVPLDALRKLLACRNHALRLGVALIIKLGGIQAQQRIATKTRTRAMARIIRCSPARLAAAWRELRAAGLIAETVRPTRAGLAKSTDANGKLKWRYPARVVSVASQLTPRAAWTAAPETTPDLACGRAVGPISNGNPQTEHGARGFEYQDDVSSTAGFADVEPSTSEAASPPPPASPVPVIATPARLTPARASTLAAAILGGAAARPTENQSRRLARLCRTESALTAFLRMEAAAMAEARSPWPWILAIAEAERSSIRAGTWQGSFAARALADRRVAPDLEIETDPNHARDWRTLQRLLDLARAAEPGRAAVVLDAAAAVAGRLDSRAAEAAAAVATLREQTEDAKRQRSSADHARAVARAANGAWSRTLDALRADPAVGAYDVKHFLAPIVPSFKQRQRLARLQATDGTNARWIAEHHLARIVATFPDGNAWTWQVTTPDGRIVAHRAPGEQYAEPTRTTQPEPDHRDRSTPVPGAAAAADRPAADRPADRPAPAHPPTDDATRAPQPPAPAAEPAVPHDPRLRRAPRADAIAALRRQVATRAPGWQTAARVLARFER